jgi:hypothetical protein
MATRRGWIYAKVGPKRVSLVHDAEWKAGRLTLEVGKGESVSIGYNLQVNV